MKKHLIKNKSFKPLDEEEAYLMKSIEEGKTKPAPNQKKLMKQAVVFAKNTNRLLKDKTINIRISSSELDKLKLKADQKGLPYTTIVATLIRQYSNDEIKVRL